MNEILDVEATYEAMHHGAVRFMIERDVVRVSGPDTLSYLEGQCSQHVSDLHPGESVETLLLSPQGKVDSYGHVALDAGGVAAVVVERGFGEATLDRLRRFKFRVKVELSLVVCDMVSLWGPNVESLTNEVSAQVVIDLAWPGCAGKELIGIGDFKVVDEVPEGDPAALEIVRIESGIPALGRELSDKTIPQESGIVDRTVSFTKGCFTGQELVARIDARGGNVPRHLRSVIFEDSVTSDDLVGVTHLVLDGRDVGTLTSSVWSPRLSRVIGLGYVRRDFDAPGEAIAVNEDREMVVRIEAVPLYRP